MFSCEARSGLRKGAAMFVLVVLVEEVYDDREVEVSWPAFGRGWRRLWLAMLGQLVWLQVRGEARSNNIQYLDTTPACSETP